ncbi:hypothetical protein [Syntrophobotulus glycolicus]|uniref:hypothetical protein n=1 Tax=Syntrophobotulus glycolicus TaxID=51197 RepID=UPI000317DBE6|nr:hypothetical protein [Syntrophobotulus glycolicus]
MRTELTFYRKRLSAFLSNIQVYQYYDICSADSIKDLIKHRWYYLYRYSGLERIDLETQDVIELLQNIIILLETYNNYNIAFVTRNEEIEGKINCAYYCVVKERQAALLEIAELSEAKPGVRLSVTEPMLVKAFHEYFKEIWEQIAPVNKNKQELIQWLQSQINLLKK